MFPATAGGPINKFLLAGGKFIPERYLRQPWSMYSACAPFTKNKEQIQKFKACFQHDMAYGDFKDLPRRTASNKVLLYKAFNIAKNLKYDGCQRGFNVKLI